MSGKKAIDSFFKKAGDFYMKHMSRSGHLKDYLPGGDKPAEAFRFPAPGSQPDPQVPVGLKTHKYDIAYYRREGIRTGAPMKPNVPLVAGSEAKLLAAGEEGLADELKVLPMHIEKPFWWTEQEAYVKECDDIGVYTAGISPWRRDKAKGYGYGMHPDENEM
eukprot:CAMPEP_0197524534 /NCGR_PEP_ID=MMETSP1318-20131121/9184_1 /TAXON_ID=552666 /ORGANISM="Partenskyella glossopodia, Strain RCC365" /LENGTH=161 /DNA_ID=CAMNT_0043077509 /DNA_START=62 /DNA_END=547 /DNA_ORIENTATION=+